MARRAQLKAEAKATAKALTLTRKKDKKRSEYKQPEQEEAMMQKVEKYAREQPVLLKSHFYAKDLAMFLEKHGVVKSGKKEELQNRIIAFLDNPNSVKPARKRKRDSEGEDTPPKKVPQQPKRRRALVAVAAAENASEQAASAQDIEEADLRGKGKEKESVPPEKTQPKVLGEEKGKTTTRSTTSKGRKQVPTNTAVSKKPAAAKPRGRPRKLVSQGSTTNQSLTSLLALDCESLQPAELLPVTQALIEKLRFCMASGVSFPPSLCPPTASCSSPPSLGAILVE